MSVYDYLEFKHFRSIIAIAEEGTITAAAARISLAQSALSRQINELEEALHIQIFERDHGGMILTPQAKRCSEADERCTSNALTSSKR